MSDDPRHAGLRFGHVDPGTDDAAEQRLALGWMEGLRRGFHGSRSTEEFREVWRETTRRDGVTNRGVWDEHPGLGEGTMPVATYCSFAKDLNVGDGRRVPLHMISDVTVSPTHRRRGLLRRLITEDLRDAAERGLSVAALTASEGAIYGRFGFGVATRLSKLSVDTRRFRLTPAAAARVADAGRLVLLEPGEAWPAVAAVFEGFHERTRGSVGRPWFYEPLLTGRFDFEDGPDQRLRTVVHLDPDGTPDGYAAYRPAAPRDGARTVEVRDLAATGPAAYLALWDYLASLDLVSTVTWDDARVDDALPWALVEPRAVTIGGVYDHLWVRVLDVPAALAARPWQGTGRVVLGVIDPLGHADGTWEVDVEGGAASVARTSREVDLWLEADTLGMMLLGGVGTARLADAGRLRGEPAALRTWSDLADGGPPPYGITGF